MQLPFKNLFKKGVQKDKKITDKKLLEDYEKGRILQINNGIDNKIYLKEKENENNP